MTKDLNPPISWMGGKTRMRDNIIPVLESIPHDLYCEPFGGSAAILIAKRKSRFEVYNDSNRLLANLFRELRDPEAIEVFKRLADVTPMSREFWCELRDVCFAFWRRDDAEFARLLKDANLDKYKPKTVAAFCFMYCMRIGFGGNFLQSFGGGQKEKILSDSYKATVEVLEQYKRRFSLVNIENVDAFDIFNKYDGEKTLFYVDPPYTSESSKAYKSGWNDDSTRRLVETLATLRGSVVLSCYDGELYEPLLDKGFRRENFEAFASAGKNVVDSARVETIYIKANQEPAPRLF